MKSMKAIVKTKEGPGNVELMEMPVPEVKENEVKIKVDCAGICEMCIRDSVQTGPDTTPKVTKRRRARRW